MFHNVKTLNMEITDNNELNVTAMVSGEGEMLHFCHKVKIEGSVCDWMNSVVKEMQSTNRYTTKKAIYVYGTEHKSRCVLFAYLPK